MDRLLMENYLLILKSTVEVFVHGSLESSNEDVRNLLKKGLNEIMSMQARTYDLMSQYGWYPVNNVKKAIIQNTLDNLEKQ